MLVISAICMSGMPGAVQAVLVIVVIAGGYAVWQRDVTLRRPFSVHRLRWLADCRSLQLICRNGDVLVVSGIRAKMVLPFLVILNLDVQSKTWPRVLFVFRDSCSQRAFRRLRVLARFAAQDVSAP